MQAALLYYMSSTQLQNRIRGRGCRQTIGERFVASLWRADIPSEGIEEHGHASGHFVLALDAGYISEAIADGHHAPPMTLIYSPPGVAHRDRCRNLGDRFLVVELDNSLLEDRASEPLWVRDPDALAAAGKIAGSLASIGVGKPDSDIDDAVLTLAERASLPGAPEKFAPDWVDDVFDALRDLSDQSDLRMADLAKQIGVHPAHLSRTFRKKFGCSPSFALRRFRVWRAATFLSSGVSLAQVALDCGFADQSHLTRSFSHMLGTTPGLFRQAFA